MPKKKIIVEEEYCFIIQLFNCLFVCLNRYVWNKELKHSKLLLPHGLVYSAFLVRAWVHSLTQITVEEEYYSYIFYCSKSFCWFDWFIWDLGFNVVSRDCPSGIFYPKVVSKSSLLKVTQSHYWPTISVKTKKSTRSSRSTIYYNIFFCHWPYFRKTKLPINALLTLQCCI